MKSRKRNRLHSEEFLDVGFRITDSNGSNLYTPFSCYPLTRLVEDMSDVIGNRQNDFNPCYHEKLIDLATPVSEIAVEASVGDFTYYSFTKGGIQASNLLGVLQTLDFGLSDWLDDFGANATDHFTTLVSDSSSLINFLLEAIEVCEGNLKVVSDVSKKLSKAIETFWSMLRKHPGDHWLAWNFAIKPAIRDVHSMVTVIERAQKRLRWLRDRNHRDTKVYYREGPRSFSGVVTTDPTWVYHVPGGPIAPPIPPQLSCEISYEADVVLSSWAWIRFDIPDYLLDDTFLALGMITLTMEGVYNPLKIVWEAVPFSWLIEWFTNRRLQLKKELLSLKPFPDGVILGVGHSIHIKNMEGETTVVCDNATGEDRTSIGSFRYEKFDRRPGTPSGNPAVRPIVPTDWQLSILGALGAKGRNPKRRR